MHLGAAREGATQQHRGEARNPGAEGMTRKVEPVARMVPEGLVQQAAVLLDEPPSCCCHAPVAVAPKLALVAARRRHLEDGDHVLQGERAAHHKDHCALDVIHHNVVGGHVRGSGRRRC